MKLTVKRLVLLEALSRVILTGGHGGHVCRFTAKGGELALFSEGDNVALVTSIKAKIIKGGEVCLDADKVLRFLRADPEPVITMNVIAKKVMDSKRVYDDITHQMVDRPDKKTKTIVTLAGRYSTTDTATGVRDIPRFKIIPNFTSSILNLADRLKEVKYAADFSTYSQHPILTGVYFDSDKLAAADGFRLAVTKLHNRDKLSFILPVKAVSIILALATAKMQVAVTKDRAIFKAKDMLIVCKIIKGQFPNYEKLIPTKGKKITFPTKLFKEAIRAALKLKGDHLVIESKGSKGAVITAKMDQGAYYSSVQSASIFSANVPCRGKIRISLIGKQLLELLDHVPTAEVVFKYEDQNKPILVKNNGSSHVLMPIAMPKKEVITPQSLGVHTPPSEAVPVDGGDNFPDELAQAE